MSREKSRQIEAIYPLSPMQQGMLFHTVYAPESGVYFHQVRCTLEGELDAGALQQAWQQVVDRHPVLRTGFVWEQQKRPLQVVRREVKLRWRQEDWRGLGPAEQEARLSAHLAADRARGFDLSKPPLMRYALARTADDSHEFVWSYHHILLDGWSVDLVFKEVFAFYEAARRGRAAHLPQPRPFQDYITWLKGQDMAAAEAFWRETLRGFRAPTPVGLPQAQPAEGEAGKDYDEAAVELSEEATAALNAFARRHQLTFNTLVQGAWALLLSRYGGGRDIVFGATVSGRPPALPGVETMLGLFLNTLPVRVKVDDARLLPEWLREMQSRQVEARQYEYSPLVQIQGWSEVPRRLPLFETLYVFENFSAESLASEAAGGLRVRNVRALEQTNYPLNLMAWQKRRLLLKLFYDRRRFEAATVARALSHLRALLEGMAADPYRPLARLEMLAPDEREQLLVRWNETRADYPAQTGLHRLFEAQAARTPDATALVSADVSGEASYSYAELNRRANWLARYLQRLGVGPEVLVGVCLPRSPEMVVALLAILKAGGAYLPLDPAYPQPRLSFMVRDSRIKVLLTDSALSGLWADEAARAVCLDAEWGEVEGESADDLTTEVAGENLAYVIYTSGSTGVPKGVQIPHAAVVNLLTSMSRRPGLNDSDTLLAVTTLSFDIAALEIFLPLVNGARLALATRETAADARQLAAQLERRQVTAMQATPVTWRMLVESGWAGRAGLKVLCGGEALGRGLAEQLLSRGREVWNLYGPTETTIWSAVWRVEAGHGGVSIGRPIANTSMYVLDERMRPAPVGLAGELYIGGDGLARGYLRRADLTAERFVPNPYAGEPGARLYRTGDLARYLPSGEIEYVGRADHQVKVRGFRIELGEIEAALEEHPAVAEAVVVARESASGDKRLVAYVVARETSATAAHDASGADGDGPKADATARASAPTAWHVVPQLRAHLAARLPEYMLPSAYVRMERWPLTDNGKVDRKALPAPGEARPDLAQAYVGPRTAAEEIVADAWGDVLGVGRVGVHDDFFELGGHSLLAMQVVSRLRETFHLDLPLRLLFRRPTVAALAESVEAELRAGRELQLTPIDALPRDGRLPLSFAQQRLWFLDQLEPGSPFYNLGGAVRLRGPLDIPALRRALDEIIRRHEALRTSFDNDEGGPRQVIAPAAGLPVPLVDLGTLGAREREAEMRRLAVAEAQLPFDLKRGPLLRATLLRLAAREHVVLLTMHHIISDAWSVGLLIREIGLLYEAFSRGEASPLAELKIQYADYAGWQQGWLRGEVVERLLDYWRGRLADAPLILDLPADRARPPVQSYRGAVHEFEIGAELTDRLKALGRQHGATLFMTLLAAFQTLLYRYTGQEDFIVGTPVANRGRAELEPLIGFFVNMLALRSRIEDGLSFRELLGRVRETALDAYAHQDLPFERLVEELQPERDLSRSPVFQVLFALQNAPTDALPPGLSGVGLSVVEIDRGIAKYDLSLSLLEERGGLRASFEYSTELFAAPRIARMAGHFVKLLEDIVAAPDQRLTRFELMGEEERRRLLVEWNRTERNHRWEVCVHNLIEQQAAARPGALALTYDDEQMTFGELNRRANQLAHYLRARGVGPEVLVGICVERSLEWVVGLLAILKAGGASVALDPSYPEDRLAFMLQDSSAPVLLTQERLKDKLASRRAPVICLDADWGSVAAESEENPEPRALPDNLAYITYTSGSTGRPKAVLSTHRALLNLVMGHRRAGPVEPTDRSPQLARMGFDASLWELWVYLTAGASVHLMDEETRLSPTKVREWLAAKRITVGWLPPVLSEAIFDEDWSQPTPLRLLITGSDRARRHPPPGLPFPYVNSYGPTEATVIVTWGVVAPNPDSDGGPPIGRPLDNTQIYILDRHLQPLPLGVPGELCIGGVCLARGYLNNPDLTAAKFVPDPFGSVPGMRLYRSGDLARIREDGNIEFLGRIDDQVKIRGFRIELGEIETLLVEHPEVRAALVILVEQGADDRRLAAYVVPQRRPQEDDRTEEDERGLKARLAQYLREKLPAYMLPSGFVLLDEIPLTPNGKLNRRALPPPEWTGAEAAETYVAPRTPTEERLARIWAEVLKVERVGAGDNFFALGGHSLLATQLASRVREQFGVEISLRAFFMAPTVAGLAEHVEAESDVERGAPDARVTPVSRLRPLPLSFAQQRLWFIDQLDPASGVYNVPSAVRLSGALNVGALAASLEEIVARHESLRTRFVAVAGQPQQVIDERVSLALPVVDLGGLPGHAREAEVVRRARAEARRGFDLSSGPLLRAVLLRLEAGEHVALLTMHHIVSDAWSMGVLISEVAAVYAAYTQGRPSPLAPLPVQYADFAVWQRERLRGRVLEEQLNYWKAQLAGAPALLELPTDRPRPPVQTYRGAQLTSILPVELTRALDTLSQGEGATLFMTLLAAWQIFLSRYTGQEDFLVGTPIANRNRAEVENLIGFFVNTLVLRTDLSGNPTFRGLLGRVREACLGAYAHQDVPFEKLVEELQPERDLSRSPLFQVMFVLQNAPQEKLVLPGLSLKPLVLQDATAHFDLTLTVWAEEDGLAASLEYNTDLFEEATCRRMLEQFQTLLGSIAADPEQRVSRLPLLPKAERRRLLEEWNDTRAEFPREVCLHQLFEAQAARTPDADALVYEGERLTYRELDRRADLLARHLRSLGVGPEVLVGIHMERSLEMVVALVGVLKAGGAYLPLDPAYPRERLAFMVSDAGARVLLAQQRLADRLPTAEARVVCVDAEWDEIVRHGAEPSGGAATADNLACLFYTSGSTGKPKGVLIDHRALVNYVSDITRRFGMRPADRFLQFASLSFDVSIEEVFPALVSGAAVVMSAEAPSVHDLSRVISREGLTVFELPTAFWHEWVSELRRTGEAMPEHLRMVIVGGEHILPERLKDWRETVGRSAKLTHVYGLTETAVTSTTYGLDPTTDAPPFVRGLPVGRPVANTEIYLLDRDLQPVPTGAAGELCIGGRGLARGYHRRPELTAARFVPHPFSREAGARLYRTNDLARYLPDGNLEFLGRMDEQVKVRGFRVELGEIEAALGGHPAVREAVVTLREDEPGDKRLVAYVVADAEPAPTDEELRRHLRETLPEYMIPSAVVRLGQLPLAPNGKVNRRALPPPGASRPELTAGYVEPATPAEEMLAGVWAELLRVERVGRFDNFFELGGHSLLATQLVSRLRQRFNWEVSLRTVFEEPTVSRMAAAVASGAGAAETAPMSRQRDRDLPLSFAQERLWFVDQLEPGNPAYNVALAVRLTGALDAPTLARSLAEIVRRHEALRTTFPAAGGRPVQLIHPPSDVPLPVVDLSRLPAGGREAEARRLAADEALRPFDLAAGPLLRVALLRLSAGEHVLLLTTHHIISDGWSMSVFVAEVTQLYAAYAEGRESPLEELPVQYADYALWQRGHLTGDVLGRQLDYWKRALAGAPEALELPTDRPRPPVQGFRGADSRWQAEAELLRRLRELSRREGTTLFMTLLAAFDVLLTYLTGQEDIVVGTDVANRNRSETENLIGFFVNQLVLRTDTSGDPTFAQLLRRVREVTLAAYTNQDVPFGKLVEVLKPARSRARNPLFQVLFILHDEPALGASGGEALPGGLGVSVLDLPVRTAKFDFSFHLWDAGETLEGTFVFNRDLFDAATFERWGERFKTVLARAADAPDAPLSELKGALAAADREAEAERERRLKEMRLGKFKGLRRAAPPQVFQSGEGVIPPRHLRDAPPGTQGE